MTRWLILLLVTLVTTELSAQGIYCGVGNSKENLKLVRYAKINSDNPQEVLYYRGSNSEGVRSYSIRIFSNYKKQEKDVIELSLSSQTNLTSISSQKVESLEDGDVFTLYLVGSDQRKFLQLLCYIFDTED